MKHWGQVLLLSVFLAVPVVSSGSASGTEGAAFLDIPVGAGPAAMGSAYTALATDAYAPIYNPAGLGFVTNPEISGQHLSYLQSMDYEFGSFVMPLGRPQNGGTPTKAFGASVQYLGSGNIAETDTGGAPTGDFSAYYAAYSLSYGQKLTENISVGLTGKAIEAKIADTSASAYAADIGAMAKATDNLNLAATLTNLGNKLTFSSQGDSLPMAAHISAAYQMEKHWKTVVEGVYSKTGLWSGRVGTEWTPLEAISLRAGYKTDTTQGLSPIAGLTLGMGVHIFGQEFAYAWLPYGDLGMPNILATFEFGAKDEEKRNLIQYQNIKTHRSADKPQQIKQNDAEYEQLMQLLSDKEAQTAQAPANRPLP